MAECVVCHDAPRNAAMLPCTHACACLACSHVVLAASADKRKCPVCRAPITGALQLFL